MGNIVIYHSANYNYLFGCRGQQRHYGEVSCFVRFTSVAPYEALPTVVKDTKQAFKIQKKSETKVARYAVEIRKKTGDLVVVWNFVRLRITFCFFLRRLS